MKHIRDNKCSFCRKNPEITRYFVPDPESDVKVSACKECDEEIQKAGGIWTYEVYSTLKRKHMYDRLANRKK